MKQGGTAEGGERAAAALSAGSGGGQQRLLCVYAPLRRMYYSKASALLTLGDARARLPRCGGARPGRAPSRYQRALKDTHAAASTEVSLPIARRARICTRARPLAPPAGGPGTCAPPYGTRAAHPRAALSANTKAAAANNHAIHLF